VDILRNGIVMFHLVFYAPIILGLEQPEESDQFKLALSLLAHEAAHVQERTQRDKAFPRTDLQPPQFASHEAAQLTPVSEIIWEEYAACRLSAPYSEAQLPTFVANLIDHLDKAREQANEAIIKYRLHASIPRVLVEAANPLIEPLRLLGYVLGHTDGVGGALDDLSDVNAALARAGYSHIALRLCTELRSLWENTWASRFEFETINGLVRDVLAAGGLMLRTRADGSLYVDIPFTPETMPRS
jgi:hypothetical protein